MISVRIVNFKLHRPFTAQEVKALSGPVIQRYNFFLPRVTVSMKEEEKFSTAVFQMLDDGEFELREFKIGNEPSAPGATARKMMLEFWGFTHFPELPARIPEIEEDIYFQINALLERSTTGKLRWEYALPD